MLLFPCFAEADREAVTKLARLLEIDPEVTVALEDSELAQGGSVIEQADWGLHAKVLLLFLSPGSIPARWVREEWEQALVTAPRESGVDVVTLLLRDCKFPELLRRRNFFDLRQGPGSCVRELRRRLIRESASAFSLSPARVDGFSIGPLEDALLGQPGSLTIESSALAQEFARACAPDFRAVYWVPCRGRTMPQICGELAWQMGLMLDGRVEENVAALRVALSQRRLLLVLDGVESQELQALVPERGSSVLITSPAEICAARAPDVLCQALSACHPDCAPLALAQQIAAVDARPGDFAEPLDLAAGLYRIRSIAAVPLYKRHAAILRRPTREQWELREQWRAVQWALDGDWPLAAEISNLAISFLRANRRFAEAEEWLWLLVDHAMKQGDERIRAAAEWELGWILEHWKMPLDSPVRAADPGTQLELDFHS